MFGGGGGGLNPRKMKQMMEQMGIDMEDVDAEEVIIRTPDEELYFSDADVQLMEAQGQQTYQVVGEPESRDRDGDGTGADVDTDPDVDSGDVDPEPDDVTGGGTPPDDDVELVSMRAGVDEATAREALEETDGDLAAAVERLE